MYIERNTKIKYRKCTIYKATCGHCGRFIPYKLNLVILVSGKLALRGLEFTIQSVSVAGCVHTGDWSQCVCMDRT